MTTPLASPEVVRLQAALRILVAVSVVWVLKSALGLHSQTPFMCLLVSWAFLFFHKSPIRGRIYDVTAGSLLALTVTPIFLALGAHTPMIAMVLVALFAS